MVEQVIPDAGKLVELAERVEIAKGPGTAVLILASLEAVYPKPPSEYKPRGNPVFSLAFTEWARVDAKVRNLVQFGGLLDAATSLFPDDCFYRSGHDGAGPDVTQFYCEAIPSAPNGLPLQAVRAVAETEPLARAACALKARARAASSDTAKSEGEV